MVVRIKLFKSYCSSIFGCELWNLSDSVINEFCVAWRKALRRVVSLPYNAHSFLLPLLTDTLPIFDEICRRVARFTLSCLGSPSLLVRSIVQFGIDNARFNSCIGRNVLFCCNYFNWKLSDLLSGNISLDFYNMNEVSIGRLSEDKWSNFIAVLEVLLIRDGFLTLDKFSQADVKDIIVALSS